MTAGMNQFLAKYAVAMAFTVLAFASAQAHAMIEPVKGEKTKNPREYAQKRVEFSENGFVEFKCEKCSAMKGSVFIASSSSCGSGGCEYLMFEKSGKEFKFVTKVFLATDAFQFLKAKNKGYPDILTYTHQSADYGELMTFRFDGKSYQPYGTVRRVKSGELAKAMKAEKVNRIALSKDLKVLEP